MRQITVRQARRELSEAKVKEWMPFQLVSDGEVIAVVTPQYDVRLAKKPSPVAKPDVALAEGLRFSKGRQALGKLSDS